MRKASKTDYGYNSTFPCRLRKIMDDNKTTQATLANECGVERQSVAQWRDGNTRPDILSLKKIAEFYNISTDYLLGLSEASTQDAELKTVCEYTGLSEKSIKKLVDLKNKKNSRAYSDLLSCLIDDVDIEYFLGLLEGYIIDGNEKISTDLAMSRATFQKKDISIFAASECLKSMLDNISPTFKSNYLTTDQRLEILLAQKSNNYVKQEDGNDTISQS